MAHMHNAMEAHGVHGVVGFVAMKSPIARRVGQEVERPHRAHRNVGGGLRGGGERRGPGRTNLLLNL